MLEEALKMTSFTFQFKTGATSAEEATCSGHSSMSKTDENTEETCSQKLK
jgi:hypothetical protein